MPDLDDVTQCPLASRCATCGNTGELPVCTASTRIGVFWLTLCGGCATNADFPELGWAQAAALVAEHCGHLDIDLDTLAHLLDREERR